MMGDGVEPSATRPAATYTSSASRTLLPFSPSCRCACAESVRAAPCLASATEAGTRG